VLSAGSGMSNMVFFPFYFSCVLTVHPPLHYRNSGRVPSLKNAENEVGFSSRISGH